MPRPEEPRAVLVDIGETLFSEAPVDSVAMAGSLAGDERFAPHLPAAALLAAEHASGSRRVGEWTVMGWLSRRLPGDLAAQAEIVAWVGGVRMTAKPGAREVLERLRAAAVPVGVVSNTTFSARAWRHAFQLHRLPVDFIVSSGDVGARKPDRRIFEAALAHLPSDVVAEPGSIWFVGDSWIKDVRGASSLGLRPFLFGVTEAPEPEPRCTAVPDWPTFAALLDRIKGVGGSKGSGLFDFATPTQGQVRRGSRIKWVGTI